MLFLSLFFIYLFNISCVLSSFARIYFNTDASLHGRNKSQAEIRKRNAKSRYFDDLVPERNEIGGGGVGVRGDERSGGMAAASDSWHYQ